MQYMFSFCFMVLCFFRVVSLKRIKVHTYSVALLLIDQTASLLSTRFSCSGFAVACRCPGA